MAFVAVVIFAGLGVLYTEMKDVAPRGRERDDYDWDV